MNNSGGFDASVEFTGPGGQLPLQVVQREVAKAWDVECYYAGTLLDAGEGAVGANPSPNYVLGMEEIVGVDPNVPFAGPAPIPNPTEEVRGWEVNAEVDVTTVEIQLRTVPATVPGDLAFGPVGAMIAFQLMNLGNVQYAAPAGYTAQDFYFLNSLSPNLALLETHQQYTLTAPIHYDPGDLMAVRIFEIRAGLIPVPGDLMLRIF